MARAGGVKFRAIGLKQVDDNLRDAVRAINRSVRWRNSAGRRLVAEARRRVHSRTGRLAGSIKAETSRDGVSISSDTPYTGVINFGWPAHGITGRHFMDGAVEHLRGELVNDFEDDIRSVLRKL